MTKTKMILVAAILALVAWVGASAASAQDGPSVTADPMVVAEAGTYEVEVSASGFTVASANLAVCNTADTTLLAGLPGLTQYCGGLGSSISFTDGAYSDTVSVEVGEDGAAILIFELRPGGESSSTTIVIGEAEKEPADDMGDGDDSMDDSGDGDDSMDDSGDDSMDDSGDDSMGDGDDSMDDSGDDSMDDSGDDSMGDGDDMGDGDENMEEDSTTNDGSGEEPMDDSTMEEPTGDGSMGDGEEEKEEEEEGEYGLNSSLAVIIGIGIALAGLMVFGLSRRLRNL